MGEVGQLNVCVWGGGEGRGEVGPLTEWGGGGSRGVGLGRLQTV